jgi:uncharacterized protein YndB with AHSA1/START domain
MPDATPTATAEAARNKFRVMIDAPIDDVWHAITRTDEPILAFFNSRMDVHRFAPGAALAMRSPDGKYTGVVGRILECDPPRCFAHTFRFTNYDDPECTVRYDLEEVDGKVQFTLTISDLREGTKSAKQMLQGGTFIVNTLKSVIETGKPGLGSRLLLTLFSVMAPFTPKRCRSEHWPIDTDQPERSRS